MKLLPLLSFFWWFFTVKMAAMGCDSDHALTKVLHSTSTESNMWKFKPFAQKEPAGLEGRYLEVGNLKVQLSTSMDSALQFPCPKRFDGYKRVVSTNFKCLDLVLDKTMTCVLSLLMKLWTVAFQAQVAVRWC